VFVDQQALRESTGAKHENYFFYIALFDGKTLSKHDETPSACRKGQGQYM
jgi:hypothetical protein